MEQTKKKKKKMHSLASGGIFACAYRTDICMGYNVHVGEQYPTQAAPTLPSIG